MAISAVVVVAAAVVGVVGAETITAKLVASKRPASVTVPVASTTMFLPE